MPAPPLAFRATLPPIGGAVRISGTGDGARIQLDVPEIEINAIKALMDLRGKTLIIVIQEEPSDDAEPPFSPPPPAIERRALKRRV